MANLTLLLMGISTVTRASCKENTVLKWTCFSQIERRHPQRDLEVEIVDRYQANAVRSMQSLSGGESFLVSLALALGLSELSSMEGSIDSLFIDEGFGSLENSKAR